MARRVAAVVLAAGGSSRMGRAKQLLDFRGQALVRRAAEAALATSCRPVFVVLGADVVDAARALSGLDVHACENANWRAGMGRSIKVGVRGALDCDPALDAVLLTLCDQPLVGPAELGRLLDAGLQNEGVIVATTYPGSPGVPALFPRAAFPELLAIADAAGAKSLIAAHAAGGRVVTVSIPSALTDVDTPDDYARLNPAGREGPDR